MAFVPFDALWLAVAAVLVASAGSLARLRAHHTGLWLELGGPGMLPRQGVSTCAALTRFYWSRRVGRLGDPSLSRWVTALRAGQLGLVAVQLTLLVQILGV